MKLNLLRGDIKLLKLMSEQYGQSKSSFYIYMILRLIVIAIIIISILNKHYEYLAQAFLALVFFKLKAKGKQERRQFHKDGRRKTFKDFQKEKIENDPNGVYGEAILAQTVAGICDLDKRKYILMKNLFQISFHIA